MVNFVVPMLIVSSVWVLHISILYRSSFVYSYLYYFRAKIPVVRTILNIKVPGFESLEYKWFLSRYYWIPLIFVLFPIKQLTKKKKDLIVFAKVSYVVLIVAYQLRKILNFLHLWMVYDKISQSYIYPLYFYRIREMIILPFVIMLFFGIDFLIKISTKRLSILLEKKLSNKDKFEKTFSKAISCIVLLFVLFTQITPIQKNPYYISKEGEESALYLYEETKGNDIIVSFDKNDSNTKYAIRMLFEPTRIQDYNSTSNLSVFLKQRNIDYFVCSSSSIYYKKLYNGCFGDIVWELNNESIIVKVKD